MIQRPLKTGKREHRELRAAGSSNPRSLSAIVTVKRISTGLPNGEHREENTLIKIRRPLTEREAEGKSERTAKAVKAAVPARPAK